MRRIFLSITAVVVAIVAAAQTPEAIRQMISRNVNFADPTVAPYHNIERGTLSKAPRGYKPFYFTMVSRHGSRYELRDTTFCNFATVYNRAAELGILTPLGEEIRQVINRASAEQMGRGEELTALGQKQLRDIGRRAYQNFSEVFRSGALEGKSSTRMRCVFSMVAFVDGLKEKHPTLQADIDARDCYMPLMRPMVDNPATPKDISDYCRYNTNRGAWKKESLAWGDKQDMSAMLTKVVTRPELLVEQCGVGSLFMFVCRTYHLLLFAQNLEIDTRELLERTFTLDELYAFYVYKTVRWLHWTGGVGHPVVETFVSYMRPMVEDILNQAQAAIDGTNPYVANLRFTHDSYLTPLLTIFGYKGLVLQYSDDWERAATSVPFSTIMPMAANLQIVLYRNKRGEVLVRSLMNENDVYLPIESPTAPFYKWEDMKHLAYENLSKLDATREKMIPEIRKNKK